MLTIDQILGHSTWANAEEYKSAVNITLAVVTALSELPEGIPSGHLYAMLMGKFTNVNAYESFIGMLERTGFIRRKGDVIFYNHTPGRVRS